MGGEVAFGGTSTDGLSFEIVPRVLAKFGLRTVKVGDWFYHFSKNEIFASKDGVTDLMRVGWSYISFPYPMYHNGWLYLTWMAEKGEFSCSSSS